MVVLCCSFGVYTFIERVGEVMDSILRGLSFRLGVASGLQRVQKGRDRWERRGGIREGR